MMENIVPVRLKRITQLTLLACVCLLGPRGGTATAQTLTTLYSFSGPDGGYPWGGLVQGSDGYFYGTAEWGGSSTYGTVFRISSSGTLTTLHSFINSDGANPSAGLVQGSDSNFYGTTEYGGISRSGTVFRISSVGTLTSLYMFTGSDGAWPQAGLVQGSDGSFYGTTSSGGANHSYGTVFRVSSVGTLTTLHSFSGSEGYHPTAGLVQGSDSNFYGTTFYGGSTNCNGGCGTVFRISSSGSLTTVHAFTGSDGYHPMGGLVQGNDGNFYGTTEYGGATGSGTVFQISSVGTLTTLHSFSGSDGSNPAGLVQGSDGSLYGATFYGGTSGSGTVFWVSASGYVATLHSFGGSDGAWPSAGLVQANDGSLYGTTQWGGTSKSGTVFRMSLLNAWKNAAGGKWETGSNWSLGVPPSLSDVADFITNASTKTVAIDATTAGSNLFMTINNLTVSAPSGATNTLFVNNAGTATPLQVLSVLTLGTNGAMVVNNSAVQSANSVNISSASSSLTVTNGGSLIATNASRTGSVVVNAGSVILGTATFKTDNLIVTNGGAVQNTQTYQVDNGSITVSSGAMQVGSNLVVASSANSTGTVMVAGGEVVVTNGTIGIGNNGTLTGGSGTGAMTVSNGTVVANEILLGSSVGGQGQLTVQRGGLVNLVGSNALVVANDLVVDGGSVSIQNGLIWCGYTHPGAMTMSADNASSASCRLLEVGYNSQGTLTVQSGQLTVSSTLDIGLLAGSTGSVWVNGGQVAANGNTTTVGDQGAGQLTFSGGTMQASTIVVGTSGAPGGIGTLTLAGGTLSVSADLIVGTGMVLVCGGQLQAPSGSLVIGSNGVGQLTISSGLVQANNLVLTNGTHSQIALAGGALTSGGTVVTNAQSFVVGNGSSAATFTVSGGTHWFGNGVEIANNATLTGCGTINGAVTVDAGAHVVSTCSTLTFGDTVTINGNGVVRAANGS
ncbi:MAG TPA: choice-of-anchor tandem repeat GloVer-containing protein, partial [Verrucomicrobiae bacterium]|nr:choice-of-anchor tandem repeat GloVer-containing protein [Verrucomicrobiae bacterium]